MSHSAEFEFPSDKDEFRVRCDCGFEVVGSARPRSQLRVQLIKDAKGQIAAHQHSMWEAEMSSNGK